VNPEAMARAQADQESKEKRSMLGKVSSLFSKKPDVSMARKASRPPMTLNPQVVDMQASSQTTQPPSPPPPAQGSEASAEMGVQIVKRSSNPPANAQPASGTPSREEIEKQYERIRLAASKIKPGSRVVFAQVSAGHSTISFWIEDSAGKALSQKSSEFPVEEIGNKSEKDLETLIENLLIKNGGTA